MQHAIVVHRWWRTLSAVAVALTLRVCGRTAAPAPPPQPHLLVIWGDDMGIITVSASRRGVMGSRTPTIARMAHDGAIVTDPAVQPRGTAGWASFITGQYPIRTGLTAVSFVGSPLGMQAKDATLAEVLKTVGYATGQCGTNHLGDRNEGVILGPPLKLVARILHRGSQRNSSATPSLFLYSWAPLLQT